MRRISLSMLGAALVGATLLACSGDENGAAAGACGGSSGASGASGAGGSSLVEVEAVVVVPVARWAAAARDWRPRGAPGCRAEGCNSARAAALARTAEVRLGSGTKRGELAGVLRRDK